VTRDEISEGDQIRDVTYILEKKKRKIMCTWKFAGKNDK